MEEGVGDEKDDKNERIYAEKEEKCPDVTLPDDMEKGVGDEKYDKNDILDDEKRQNAQITLLLMIWRKV